MAISTMKIVVFAFLIAFHAAKAKPNTKIQTLLCNKESYAKGNPFGDNVAYVLSDLVTVTPTQDGYFYFTVSPSSSHVAYGHATCSADLAKSECSNCLASAKRALIRGCYHRVGAQVALGDCTMRYENYKF